MMNSRQLLSVTALVLTALMPVEARQAASPSCLHGPTETAEQAQRRAAALTAARAVNTVQARLGSRGRYYSHAEMASAPEFGSELRTAYGMFVERLSLAPGTELLPGWTLTLDVTDEGYWFMVRDTTDPCGFAYVSNQVGVIYRAEPIR
jgi:hypothetical protein